MLNLIFPLSSYLIIRGAPSPGFLMSLVQKYLFREIHSFHVIARLASYKDKYKVIASDAVAIMAKTKHLGNALGAGIFL